MPRLPKKPQVGQKALQSIYNTVCDIVDYLPAVTVRGDGNTTAVDNTPIGTIVHARPQAFNMYGNNGSTYYAGSGITITSGNIINAFLSAGPNINIYYNSGALVISGTPAGSGGVGPDTNTTYIGEKQATCSCGFIYVDPNPISGDTHVIYSTLRYIGQLYNFPIDSDTVPAYEHYLQVPDLKDGAGTTVNYHYYSAGNHEADDPNAPLVKVIDGIEVDLNVSGGTYITTNFHKGVGYGDYTSASIDCNLSGDRDAYATGFISIIPQYDTSSNITGGIISTCLHGDGSTISIDSNGTISCLVSPGPGPGPSSDTNTTYTGELDVPYSDGGCPCGFIHVGQTPFSGDTHIIYSTLRNLYQLGNEGITSNDHFVQAADLKAGAGTEINYHYTSDGSHEGDDPEAPLIKTIDGIQVDLNVSGGTYITTNFYKGVGYGDQTSASIDCNLSGDRDAYATGYITIVPQRDLASNITGGIISTCLHAGSGITIDSTGEISTTGGGGGGGDGSGWPDWDNLGEESDTRVYPLMRYTTSTGGWLRISCKGGTSRCIGVWIDDNYVGLGQGIMTWPLAIPPGCSFYVDVDWGLNNLIWFDSTVTPSTTTNQAMQYWFIPPQWDPNKNTISDARNVFSYARYEETCCYSCMTGAAGDLKVMSSDWTKLTMISGSDPDAEPYSRQQYENRITSMQRYLSGEYEGDTGERSNCEYHWDEAITYCQQLNTLNTSLPSANPMFSYQITDIPAKCQQYYGKIEQYITSGQYYYDLVDQWWTQHDQQNQ